MAGLPLDALKIVIGGQIEGVQDWSCSLWFRCTLTGGSWSVANQGAVTQDLGSIVETWWGYVKDEASSSTTLERVTSYFYPAHSLTSTQVGVFTASSPIAGDGAHPHASGTSMVASLRTDVPGRSGRGRIYVPANAATIDASHNFGASDCGVVSIRTADMLEVINAYVSAPNNVTALGAIVASFSKSEMNDITSVVVDSKPDSQRRREDKMPITTVSVTVVT